mmetsp:Transcript_107888/g.303974  ORF Transcript_107888/g.303974 Transcript_107888/m.303974 type:complete len:124 (-) Transcript_107888:16-387(-)
MVSLGTLGLIGIGAGVGYGVGSWLADKYQERRESQGGSAPNQADQLPWAVQVSLQQWQAFCAASFPAGASPTPQEVDAAFAEFAAREPVHAQNVRSLTTGASASSVHSPGGPTIVATTAAAEV